MSDSKKLKPLMPGMNSTADFRSKAFNLQKRMNSEYLTNLLEVTSPSK